MTIPATGRAAPAALGTAANTPRPDQPTLAEQMAGAGYQTLLVTDNPHEFTASMNFSRGFNVVQWTRGQEGDAFQPKWKAGGATWTATSIVTEMVGKTGHQLASELR